MSLRRYAILDLSGAVWYDSENLSRAVRQMAQFRAEDEDDEGGLLLIDRRLGPMSDAGVLRSRP